MRASGIAAMLPPALVAGALLGATPVWAQGPVPAQPRPGAPTLMPTRDVTVVYAVRPEGAPQDQTVRVYFRGGGGSMRIDGPPAPDGSPSGDMIMDRDARIMTVVMTQPRLYMQVPESQVMRPPFVLDPSMRFTRTGSATVAGLACTTYAMVTDKGAAMSCVTDDGVVLSASGVDGQGAKGQLAARSVQYGPLEPALFTPPPGYQRITHPEGAAPGTGAPGSGGPGEMQPGQQLPMAAPPGTPGTP